MPMAGMGRIVIAPRGPDAGTATGGGGLVWYFDTSHESYLSEMACLPEGWALAPAGQAVNAAADRLRPVIANLEAHLFDGAPPAGWWGSAMGERNPYVGDLHLSLARSLALVEAARQGGCHWVITGDFDLGRSLAQTARLAGLDAVWQGPGARPFAHAAAVLKAVLAALRDGWRASRAVRPLRRAVFALKDRHAWLLTWAGTDFQRGIASGRDAFFGELPSWLRQWSVPFGWLGNPSTWLADIKHIAKAVPTNAEPAILLPALIPFSARLRAVWSTLGLMRMRVKALTVAGVDLSPMIRRAMDLDIRSGTSLRALPFEAIGAQCRRLGLAPHCLIYPYENQPWEKALLAGFRRHLPGVRLIGYQHSVLSTRYLSVEPGKAQLRDGLFPDVLVVAGQEFQDRMMACGLPAARLPLGGALRLDGVGPSRDGVSSKPIGTVLVTLPMQADEGLELACKAADCAAMLGELRFLVNFHPMLDEATRARIRDRAAEAGARENIAFVDGPASRWLGECDLVLYNSSGTVFEAARAGIPAIYVGPVCGLDLEKLPGGSPLRCRSSAELAELLARLRYDREAIAAAVGDMRHKAACCLAPANREIWQALLVHEGAG